MPLGPYATFGECVGAQKRKGHSDESARAICGKIQAEIEGGSSQYAAAPTSSQMSQAEMMKKEEEDSAGGSVTFTAKEIQALAQAATDNDMQKVLQIISEKVNIQEDSSPMPPTA